MIIKVLNSNLVLQGVPMQSNYWKLFVIKLLMFLIFFSFFVEHNLGLNFQIQLNSMEFIQAIDFIALKIFRFLCYCLYLNYY